MGNAVAMVGRPANGVGHYLRDLVYGATDGVITTIAVIAGATGAAFDDRVGLILGLANLLADGFSMGASNYLGLKSELEQMGVSVARERPLRHGLATFLAFVCAGAVPLLSYIPQALDTSARFTLGVTLALITVALVGAARARFLPRSPFRCAVEMVLVSAVASAAAYGLGRLVAPLIS